MWPTVLARGPPRHDPDVVRFRTSPNAPKAVVRLERQTLVVELRQGGLTYEQIADAVRKESDKREAANRPPLCTERYDKRQVFKDLKRAMVEMVAKFELHAEELRQLEKGRTEAVIRRATQMALDTKLPPKLRLDAEDCVLKASKALRELCGLDAPVQIDVNVTAEARRLEALTGVPAKEIVELAAKLTGEAS